MSIRNVINPHPRLLLDDETVGQIKALAASDPVTGMLVEALIHEADVLVDTPAVGRQMEGRRLLGVSREVLRRTLVLALAARLTDDMRYTDACMRHLRAPADFVDWNPDHFLDVAEMTAALAMGYDWLHGRAQPADLTKVREAIIRHGLETSLNVESGWWIKAVNNWNPVCHGGMVMGALAVAESVPDLATRILQRADENIDRVAHAYEPDGAYFEGPNYWNYGTTYLTLYLASLQSALGEDFDTTRIPGFKASAHYIQHCTSPTGGYFNYADNPTHRQLLALCYWFAARFDAPGLVAYDEVRLRRAIESRDKAFFETFFVKSRFASFLLIWRSRLGLVAEKSASAESLVWIGQGAVPVALMRTAWNDPQAGYLGVKAGYAGANHGHDDAGTFVYETNGVRWAVDLGMQGYESLEAKGVKIWDRSLSSERWRVFRLNEHGHSVLRFEGQTVDPARSASLIQVEDDKAIGRVRIDLTALHQPLLVSVEREMALLPDQSLCFEDSWTAGDQAVTARWQWMTEAAVSLHKNGFTLTQSGQSLHVEAYDEQGRPVAFEAIDRSQGMAPYDCENPGLVCLRALLNTPAGATGRLSLKAYTVS